MRSGRKVTLVTGIVVFGTVVNSMKPTLSSRRSYQDFFALWKGHSVVGNEWRSGCLSIK
jgi:hypothetical protein